MFQYVKKKKTVGTKSDLDSVHNPQRFEEESQNWLNQGPSAYQPIALLLG